MSTRLHNFFIVYLIIYFYFVHIIISYIFIFVHRDMPLPLMTIIYNQSNYLKHSHGSWVLWATGIPEDRRICHRHVLKVRMSQKWTGRWREIRWEMCFFLPRRFKWKLSKWHFGLLLLVLLLLVFLLATFDLVGHPGGFVGFAPQSCCTRDLQPSIRPGRTHSFCSTFLQSNNLQNHCFGL